MRIAPIALLLCIVGCESLWSSSLVPNGERCDIHADLCQPGQICDAYSGRCITPTSNPAGGLRCGAPWRTGTGPATFQTLSLPVASGSANNLVSVSLGDINSDGHIDLAAVSENTTLWSYLGSSDGQFAALAMGSSGPTPRMLRLVDVNRDGRADYLISNRTARQIRCILAAADGQFGTTSTGMVSSQPEPFVVADFDRDGALDVAAGQQGANELAVLVGNGAGAFANGQNINNSQNLSVLASADFNEDGAPDLVSLDTGAGDLYLYINNANLSFTRQSISLAGGLYAYWITVGDFDCDSHQDLAVGTTGSNRIVMLYGDGQGRFPSSIAVTLAAEPRELQAADVNGDGQPDIAFFDQFGDMQVLLSTAARQPPIGPQAISGPRATASLQVADVNKDGRADLVLVHQYQTVMTLLNTTP